MDREISNNPLLDDIRTSKARYNFDTMINYLCSKPIPLELEEMLLLDGGTLEQNHELVASILYTKENHELANYILKYRSEIDDFDSTIDGFSYIYKLDSPILLTLDSRKYFQSVGSLEHELIHLIQAVNNNNPSPQHVEILSIFGSMLTLEILSEKYDNLDIYRNATINGFVSRVSRRVYTCELEEDSLKEQSDIIREFRFGVYPYMIGFMYALRLLDLYHSYPQEILANFNCVLSGKKNVDKILEEYHISLEDEATIESFKKMCDLYEQFVLSKHNEAETRHIK